MKKVAFLLLFILTYSQSYAENINKLIAKIASDSTLEDAQNRYIASNLIDYTKNNSWSEGNDDYKGTISIEFKNKVTFSSIYIKNGYADPKYYYKNNRAKNIRFIFDNDGWADYVLTDNPGFQKISFSTPINTNKLRIEIIDVYLGTQFNDTCISKISFDVPSEEIINKQNTNWFTIFSDTIYDLVYNEITLINKYRELKRTYTVDGDQRDKIKDLSEIEILNIDDGRLCFLVKTNIERKDYNDHRDLFLSIFEPEGSNVRMNQGILPHIQKNDIENLLNSSKIFSDKYAKNLISEYIAINQAIDNNKCILANIISCDAYQNIINYSVYDYNHSNFYFHFPKTVINPSTSRISEVNYR